MTDFIIYAENRSEFENAIAAMNSNNPEFKKPEFINCSDGDIIEIAEALKINIVVTSINLRDSEIGPEGLRQ
jgi:hypothetical protein